MSHVVTVDVEIRNMQALRQACKRLGWTLKEGQTKYNWFGAWVGDSPVPYEAFDEETKAKVLAMTATEQKVFLTNEFFGKCIHAIQVPGATYEIGLIQKDKALIPLCDWFTPGGLGHLKENGMNGFVQAYAAELIKLTAEAQGQFTQETRLANGGLKIEVIEFQ